MVGTLHRYVRPVPARLRQFVATVLLVVIVYGVGTAFFPRVVPRFTFLPMPTTAHVEVGSGCYGPVARPVEDIWVRDGWVWRVQGWTPKPWISACI